LTSIPAALGHWHLALKDGGNELEYTFDADEERTSIPSLLRRLGELGIEFKDLQTRQSSLEDIFVSLVSEREPTNTSSPLAGEDRGGGADAQPNASPHPNLPPQGGKERSA
jgi:hypothetical protein